MKLKTLLEHDTVIPSFLYHATYEPFLSSIKKHGLKGGLNKNWGDSKKNLVYLAVDKDVAESYAETSEAVDENEDLLDQIVIYKIDTDKLDHSKLSTDSNVIDGDSTFEYAGVIPWNLLKRV